MELLRRGRSIGEIYPASILQALLVVAGIYLCVNVALSRVAAWLERRQSRRFGAVGPFPITPVQPERFPTLATPRSLRRSSRYADQR